MRKQLLRVRQHKTILTTKQLCNSILLRYKTLFHFFLLFFAFFFCKKEIFNYLTIFYSVPVNKKKKTIISELLQNFPHIFPKRIFRWQAPEIPNLTTGSALQNTESQSCLMFIQTACSEQGTNIFPPYKDGSKQGLQFSIFPFFLFIVVL